MFRNLFAVAMIVLAMGGFAPAWAQSPLATTLIKSADGNGSTGFDGVVEAVRQTVIAAQVPGAVVALLVKPGDMVKAGQVLVRLDARAAEQSAAASDAQVRAARAELDVARKEFERQRQLFQKQYISQAALDRAEAQFKAAEAQTASQLAQAGVTRTQSGFFVVKAPYAGIVSEVPVTLGDMAMPGRALVTLYDLAALRVTASLPQTAAARVAATAAAKVEIPGLPAERQWVVPTRFTILPSADPATHTVQVRLDLPAGLAGVAPGVFARAWLPVEAAVGARIMVPSASVVRRAEMTGVYVMEPSGKPVLRQVRLGRVSGNTVEVLSGVASGDRVALDPEAAAKVR
jgi:RND family efflux transporter MFP subunit